MIKLLSVLILSVALFLGPVTAYACHCGPLNPPLVEAEWADAVFTGFVLTVTPTADPDYVDALVQVTAFWKGVGLTTVHLYTFASGAECGFTFQQGNEYLFYAKIGMTCCGLGVALCTRTCDVSSAQDDFVALGPPVATVPVIPETWGMAKERYK